MSAIPKLIRSSVIRRDRNMCVRCGLASNHLHHRRGRSVVGDGHDQCPCNLISLCRKDHEWIHAHPAQARLDGFIVSRWGNPQTIGIDTYRGVMFVDCAGHGTLKART